MRWANLSASADDNDRDRAGQPALPGARVRTFDTPAFAGMTFYEIHAKSLINRVTGAARVPFEWTVNPYRGCSHACSYCLGGDTPILLADGSTRPLSEIVPGDAVYGTAGVGADRRYVPTTVLDHWTTRKPAFRITLADGTRLITSADHRLLTARGWRQVAPGAPGRPALVEGDLLRGVGGFADPAKEESPDYRAGYLCGLVRGDAGQQGRVEPRHTPAATVRPHAGPAWERADGYLGHVALDQALRWPDEPGEGWRRGFLAGAYAATGGTDGRAVRFTSPDRSYLHRVTEALHHLGVPSLAPTPGTAPRVATTGDLWTALRFRHLTGAQAPFEATGERVTGDERLAVVAVEPLGLTLPLYDITTGTGDFVADGVVSHNCFARHTHTYLDLDAGHDFDSKVVVKVNAGALIRRELAAARWRGGHIAMGTNVDCYQRAEGRYRLMPQIIAALRDHANPFSILTKGTLILRDLPLLRQAAVVTDVGLSFSVGFVDPTVWRDVEPGTPSPRRRLDAVRALTNAGFAVNVLMAPILPGLTDTEESIDETVAAIAGAGAAGVTPLVLHLRPGARQWYAAWLTRQHPGLVPRYRELFAGGAYAPAAYQREIGARVRLAARRHGLHQPDPVAARRTAGTKSGNPAAGNPAAGVPAAGNPADGIRAAPDPGDGAGTHQLTLL